MSLCASVLFCGQSVSAQEQAPVADTAAATSPDELTAVPANESPAETPKDLPVVIKKSSDENADPAKSKAAGKTAPHSKGSEWQVKWTSPDGKSGTLPAKAVGLSDNDRQLIFLTVPAFVSGLGDGEIKAEHKVGDEWVPMLTKEIAGKLNLALSASVEQARLTGKNGKSAEYEFKVVPRPPSLLLTSKCKKLGLRSEIQDAGLTTFPALLSCHVDNKKNGEVIFSSLADAEWYGTEIFETQGKGERWKAFSYKDIITLQKWHIKWGGQAAGGEVKTTAQIKIPVPVIPPAEAPKAKFSYVIGLNYLSGTASSGSLSASLGGLQIPIGVRFQKEGGWWLLGTDYQFFAYSLSGSNTTNALDIYAGLDFGNKSFRFIPRVGYFNRYLNTPDLQSASSFAAPRIGADLVYKSGTHQFGVSAVDAQTSSSGQFSETKFGAFYQGNWLAHKPTRLFIESTQIQASSNSVSIQANWLTFGLTLQF